MDKIPKQPSEKEQDLFEAYLMGKMDAGAEAQFLQDLEVNPELKQRFEEFKTLFLVISEDALRKKLEEFHAAVDPSDSTSGRFSFYRIAAGVALLFALGIGFWLVTRPSPNEKLFNTYYSPDPGLPTVMGTQANYAFYEAMVDYKQGAYTSAIAKWEVLFSAQTSNDTLVYFLGSAYLAQGNSEKAIEFLKRSLQSQRKGQLKDDAYYYLGLAYLKLGETEAALENLRKSGNPQSEKLAKNIATDLQ